MVTDFKSPTPLLTKKLVLRETMFPSKPNKYNISQEQNSYLISFPRYSDESFKMGHPIF